MLQIVGSKQGQSEPRKSTDIVKRKKFKKYLTVQASIHSYQTLELRQSTGS